MSAISWAIVGPVLLLMVGALVLYLWLVGRAILAMLRSGVSGVLLTFAFLALVPLPVLVVMGIAVLFIWHFHREDILTRAAGTP
jgi:hypothetical protein